MCPCPCQSRVSDIYQCVLCVFFSLRMCVCLCQSWLSVYGSLPKWSISGYVCLCFCQSGVSDGYPVCLSFACMSLPKPPICVYVSLCLPKWSIRRIRSCILLPPSVSPLTTGQSKVHQWHCHCCHWSHIRWKVVSFQDKKGECFVRLVFVLIVISASGCRPKSLYSHGVTLCRVGPKFPTPNRSLNAKDGISPPFILQHINISILKFWIPKAYSKKSSFPDPITAWK